MNDAALERLLAEAGESAPTPEPIPDLARRVRRRWAARQRRQTAVAMIAVPTVTAALVVCAQIAVYRSPGVASVESQQNENQDAARDDAARNEAAREALLAATRQELREDLAQLHAELAQLEDEVRCLREIQARNEASRRADRELADLRRELSRPDPRIAAEAEYEKTAYIMVQGADRQAQSSPPADADAAYRQVIELFPETSWANVARQRLKERESGD